MLAVIEENQNNNKVVSPVTGDVGNSLVATAEAYTDAKNSYSTTEQLTGGKWIDGKPIYRKVVDCGSLPNATIKNVAHNISNFGQLVKVYGIWYDGTWYNPLPFVGISSVGANIILNVNATYISIQTGTNRSSSTGVVTIEYTKTTD